MVNNSKVYYNGSKWMNNNRESFTIINKHAKELYLCQFEDGTIVIKDYRDIKRGRVRNPNNKSVCNVGYIGEGEFNYTNNKKEYDLWRSIITRCYNNNLRSNYSTYRDCIVDTTWHCFQTFCLDIQELDNYDRWKNSNKPREWSLDKDSLSGDIKVYSKETCVFMLLTKNSEISHITGLTYIATRIPDGYTEEFINQREFSRKWNTPSLAITRYIKTKKVYKGLWKFDIKNT